MTIAFDTSVQATSGSTSALALPALTTAGSNEILILLAEVNGGPVTSISGGSLTWHNRISFVSSAPQTAELWFAQASSVQSGVVFTVNTTTSNFVNAVIMAFSGVNTGSTPYDSNAALPASNNATALLNVTTSNANDVLVACAFTATAIANAGWNIAYQGSFFTAAYSIVQTVQTNNNPFTGDYVAVGDAYMQATAAAGGGSSTLSMMGVGHHKHIGWTPLMDRRAKVRWSRPKLLLPSRAIIRPLKKAA